MDTVASLRSQQQPVGDRVMITAALALFALAFYRLITYRPAYEGSGGLVEIGAVTVQKGVIRRRHSGSLAWNEIREGPLYLRDLVYAPPGVNAFVALKDGRVVKLPPDSLVQFDDITVSNLEITLRDVKEPKRQGFQLRPRPKTQRLPNLIDPQTFEQLFQAISQRFSAYRLYTRFAPPLSVPKVVVNPALLPLNQVSYFALKQLSPEDGQSFPLDQGNWTKISWSAIPLKKVSYLIEIALKERFQDGVQYRSNASFLEIQFDKPGKYYWRVTALGLGQPIKSQVRTFQLFPLGIPTKKNAPIQFRRAH